MACLYPAGCKKILYVLKWLADPVIIEVQTQLFPVYFRSQQCFKKNYFENQLIIIRISIMERWAPGALQFTTLDPLGSSPSAEVRPRPQNGSTGLFTKFFFLKTPVLVHRPTAAPVAAKNCR